MIKYIKSSVDKFKKDALSKVLYDVLKYLVFFLLGTILVDFIPKRTEIGRFISGTYTHSLYSIVLYSLVLIILSILFVSFLYRGKYKKLLKDNFTDELTGLKNHKALDVSLAERLVDAKNTGKTLSIIIIDVDKFKDFNEKAGNIVADQILRKLGELLGNDKRATDETFRLYIRGDEFIVVASETNLSAASQAAERKRKLIAKTTFIINDTDYKLTVSCGITEYNKDVDDSKSLINRAYTAMTSAKNNGRNQSISNI